MLSHAYSTNFSENGYYPAKHEQYFSKSMSIFPSQAIRQVLISRNLATDVPDADWRCVLLRLPDGAGVRDNILAVADVEGAVDGRYVSTGEVVSYPRIRILCRALSYTDGYALMQRIADTVDMLSEYPVTIGSETVKIRQVSRNSGIICAGLDATLRRHHFSLDYEVHVR